jgi:hypothetical protein
MSVGSRPYDPSQAGKVRLLRFVGPKWFQVGPPFNENSTSHRFHGVFMVLALASIPIANDGKRKRFYRTAIEPTKANTAESGRLARFM